MMLAVTRVVQQTPFKRAGLRTETRSPDGPASKRHDFRWRHWRHIHPALAIADEIKRRNPQANIRFVGAPLDEWRWTKFPQQVTTSTGFGSVVLNER